MRAEPVDHDPFTTFTPVEHDPFGGARVRPLFIVRHGATKLNAEAGVSVDRERGWSDVRLTKEGRQEAREAAKKLKGKGIEVIVSSDLIRAKETAQIIGEELGIEPEYSFGLRPWNLGDLAGEEMTKVTPQLRDFACKKPDEAVAGGESFHEFTDRFFEAAADIVAAHPDQTILLICHHRGERELEAWNEDGQLPDHTIDIDVFLEDGDPPGGIKILGTTEAALRGHKFLHHEVEFGEASGHDKCGNCKAFQGKNNCKKVVAPIDEDDWCMVGVSRKTGSPFDRKTGIGSHPLSGKPFHPASIGAKQAPDGNHYLPDGKRPGKYQMVVW
jgi:broad specificity phosphatase PhoE